MAAARGAIHSRQLEPEGLLLRPTGPRRGSDDAAAFARSTRPLLPARRQSRRFDRLPPLRPLLARPDRWPRAVPLVAAPAGRRRLRSTGAGPGLTPPPARRTSSWKGDEPSNLPDDVPDELP